MIKKILNFTKIEHTAFSLPLIFTGVWLGGRGHWPSVGTLTLIITAAIGARIFGMAFNRIFDRHIDALNPRTAGRELPSGAMQVKAALVIALTGLMVYIISCWTLGHWCLYLAPLPLIPLLTYSLLKRFTALCHFGIGFCMALAPLGAFVASAGYPRFTIEVLLFAAFVFFWLSGADIIYALMDMQSDRQNGIHSLPAKLGTFGAQAVAAAAHITALLSLLALLIISKAGLAASTAFIASIVFFILMYMPFVPVPQRFFPISTLAGVAGAVAPMLV